MPPRSAASADATRVRLKPHDSFDLIRVIAKSQSDARKAIGELVQNSLDAGAQRVEITWFNDKGTRTLRIVDDGSGVFPELERQAALRKIAETIGHSHKRSLSAAERREQMLLGKYGIGLLGFWSVARVLELKTRVHGGETWVLRLEEDRREAEIARARAQKSFAEETFTEITLREVKESVQRQVRPPRLQAYLAAELRGQLLQRGTEVRIHDRIARGRATKEFVVKPRAYLGLPLEELRTLEVPGHEDARLELYFVPPDEERAGVVSLSCGGTTVLDDVALVDLTDPEGRAREPWASGRFEGVIDFPDLEVAPGTRRGFVPNDAALDFLLALEKLEAALRERLAADQRERARARHEHVAREIRRAFASVARRLPEYDLMDVRAGEKPASEPRAPPLGEDRALGRGSGEETALEPPAGEPVAEPDADSSRPPGADPPADEGEDREEDALFPPGPLARVRITPSHIRLAPSTERRFRARTEDEDGRQVREDVVLRWYLEGPGSLAATVAHGVVYRAPDDEAESKLAVEARQGDRSASAEALVSVKETSASAARTLGIPEPQPVNAPSEDWRSRLRGSRWEYNEGHRDYLAVASDEPRRLRYLVHLFAKEVVLKNFGSPLEEPTLERMVEVLTHLGEGKSRP
jgi:hypothetical protein